MMIAGLDIGTTGCKISVFDDNNKYLGKEYSAYRHPASLSPYAIDAVSLKESVITVLKKAAEKYRGISAIGITSFGESFVMLDEQDRPLFSIMLYTYPCGKEQVNRLVAALGKSRIESITGLAPHEMYSLPKLMWLKEKHKELFRRAKYVMLTEDYVSYLLTGQRLIDYSLATRTLAFDIRKLKWSEEIFAAAGLEASLFSNPVPTGTSVGPITEGAAKETGLAEKTRIVLVSHDQVAAAIGAACFKPGSAVDGSGTVECLTPVMDSIPASRSFQKHFYNVVPYVIENTYLSYAFTYTGGGLLQWCADNLCKKEKEEAEKEGISVHQYLQKGYQGPTGLLVLPHFAGAATPYMDTGSKGAIIGLSESTSAQDIYQACMEGVAYELRLNLETIRKDGVRIEKLVATGGGAKSDVWLHIKADITGLPIDVMSTEEAGSVGCVIVTGLTLGRFKDYEQAARSMTRVVKTILPDPLKHKQYEKLYKRYLKLYKAVRPLV